MKSYVYSNTSVANTRRGLNNEVGWEFSPESNKRKVSSSVYPLGRKRRSNVSFRSHIGRDVADHVETSS